MNHKIIVGDTLEALKKMDPESVNCIVTSPPYWGLRDYGVEGQIGLEPTLDEYIGKVLAITKELKRVLRKDGVMFWNHGDCYGGSGGSGGDYDEGGLREGQPKVSKNLDASTKPKCQAMQNYRIAIRMIDSQGWILRNIVIWHKPNHMPSSVKDRFSNSYEPVFMFTKNKKYWFDLDAVREPHKEMKSAIGKRGAFHNHVNDEVVGQRILDKSKETYNPLGKNPGDVWKIPTQPFPEAHFAVFPEKLITPMMKAGCPKEICVKCGKPRMRIVDYKSNYIKREVAHSPRSEPSKVDSSGWKPPKMNHIGWTKCDCGADFRAGVVFDPFVGSGTTCVVAEKLGMDSIGIELNPKYVEIIKRRMKPFTQQMKITGHKPTLEIKNKEVSYGYI